jgi:hypothetical protein
MIIQSGTRQSQKEIHMSREVCLPEATRVFERAGGSRSSLLGRVDWALAAGSVVVIGDPQNMVYDHTDKIAVSFEHEGNLYWMLVEEMNVPGLIN